MKLNRPHCFTASNFPHGCHNFASTKGLPCPDAPSLAKTATPDLNGLATVDAVTVGVTTPLSHERRTLLERSFLVRCSGSSGLLGLAGLVHPVQLGRDAVVVGNGGQGFTPERELESVPDLAVFSFVVLVD